jgi:hypothetical protein
LAEGRVENEMSAARGRLSVLASLLLCDNDFNAEVAKEQRGRGGCRCGWGEKNDIILMCYET